ncbi:MAG: NADP oxidoreductase [Candidatus Omnitrophota bacterium]|nr:NADP oxidoreductase [Candidatus Omnitrophota bacterium]MDZ4242598.1 NADP oxidoreductase [Candidatus Omnitrophota bacterium]
MSQLGTADRPLRVAVIGSGPSGFYATETLLTSLDLKVSVDIFDRLPAPYGLVRYGVAPDHPKIKNVVKIYEKTADNPAVSFLGNVHVGKDILIEEIRRFYDAVIFTCGAQSDRQLGIPGETLDGCHSATEFVAWYNGHPDYRQKTFDLSHETAAVIGQGNVAMDVSRILCKTVEELKGTDIAKHALEALAESKIKEVHVIGRRGPIQAAFTPVEIREFGDLADCDPVLDPAYLKIRPESEIELEDPTNLQAKKNFEVLKSFSARPPSQKQKRFIIHFHKSPQKLLGSGRLNKLVLEKNRLVGPPGKQQAEGTGVFEEMACGLVLYSIGYRGVPIPGIPFDTKKGTFSNIEGRVMEGGHAIPGLYCAGWIKRGPTGVIGTNKPDSVMTVQKILADLPQLKPCETPDSGAVKKLLKEREIRVVSFPDWKKIDAAEIEFGKTAGKPREKFVTVEDMLHVIH